MLLLILSLLLFGVEELAFDVFVRYLAVHLGHENLDREVLVIMDAVFVFVSVINHVSIDVKDPTPVHKVCVEPAVECQFLIIIKLEPDIIINEYFGRPYEEVIV